jgi:hypothetical protein
MHRTQCIEYNEYNTMPPVLIQLQKFISEEFQSYNGQYTMHRIQMHIMHKIQCIKYTAYNTMHRMQFI